LQFSQDNFELALPTIPVGGVASTEYTLADAKKAIEANMHK
jgi:ribose transport system substrate-binding protein